MIDDKKQMTEWRFLKRWSESELQDRLDTLKEAPVNFPLDGPDSMEGSHWHRYYSESVIAQELPGEIQEGGLFLKVWRAITEYRFSDPEIVEGHFDPQDNLKDRTILLEIKVVGLRYLCGVRVRDIKQDHHPDRTVYGFRYDTLLGHMETGSEWFLLTKIHETGEIWFRISASWRPGEFPNWWSRLGFHLVGERYQLAWHRLAYLRLRDIAGGEIQLPPVPRGRALVHTGPEITNSDLWTTNKNGPIKKVIKAGGKNDESWDDPEAEMGRRNTPKTTEL